MKILITGSTSGIGFITGISLYDRGHEVIMTTHTEMECEKLRKKLKNMKLGIVVLKLDITDKKDIDKIDFSTINVLINHAGIGIGGSIIDLNIKDVKKNFDVNLFSTLELSKKFLKARINKKERSKLIITSSIAGVIPINFLGSYCSTKASLIMICKCLKKELACIDSNIQVSLIEPGVYNTGFNEVMIDKAECSMTNDSVFFYEKKEIISRLRLIFKLIGHDDLASIVCQIIKAVEDKDNYFIYSASLIQKIYKKLYLLLS